MDLLDMRAVFFNIAGVDILSPQPLELRLIKVVFNSNHIVIYIELVIDRASRRETRLSEPFRSRHQARLTIARRRCRNALYIIRLY